MRLALPLLAAILLAGCAAPAAQNVPQAVVVRAPPVGPMWGPATTFDLHVVESDLGPAFATPDGTLAPWLVVEEGQRITIRVDPGDEAHGVELRKGPGGPTSTGAAVEYSFTARADMHRTDYVCPVHPDTMRGPIWVASGEDAPYDAPVERVFVLPDGLAATDVTVPAGGVVAWLNPEGNHTLRFPGTKLPDLRFEPGTDRGMWFRSPGVLHYELHGGPYGVQRGSITVTAGAPTQ